MTTVHTLTDDQFAEWDAMMKRYEQLLLDLIESRKATESVQAAAEDARQKYHAELKRRGDTIAELLVKLNDRTNQARFNAGGLVETLAALRRLLAALEQYDGTARDPMARRDLEKIAEEAREVVRKYDIPF